MGVFVSQGSQDYAAKLAEQIRMALTSAELHVSEDFQPYAYVFGYLAGDCTDAEQAEFEERFHRLMRQSQQSSDFNSRETK
jgi:hypothetical protein